MLSKKKRVTKELFTLIMKQGGTLRVPLFIFRYIKQKEPQYAFVAPKSVAKGAHDRNRLRRQGYSALKIQALKPCAGIFFYTKEAKKATYSDIKENVSMVIEKLKI